MGGSVEHFRQADNALIEVRECTAERLKESLVVQCDASTTCSLKA